MTSQNTKYKMHLITNQLPGEKNSSSIADLRNPVGLFLNNSISSWKRMNHRLRYLCGQTVSTTTVVPLRFERYWDNSIEEISSMQTKSNKLRKLSLFVSIQSRTFTKLVFFSKTYAVFHFEYSIQTSCIWPPQNLALWLSKYEHAHNFYWCQEPVKLDLGINSH